MSQPKPRQNQRSPRGNQLIVSYMFLRQTVGWIGTLLPAVLIVGVAVSSAASLPGSMSGYYYTDMRNIFVGALCALGVFLGAYAGYDDVDRSITDIHGWRDGGGVLSHQAGGLRGWCASLPGIIGHASVD